jgi:Rieske Fe-S protein
VALDRREFLGRCAAALGAALTGAIAVPLGGLAIGPALGRNAPPEIPVGRVDSFVPNVPRLVSFGLTREDGYLRSTTARAVWVVRAADELVVYNARCTHLGCLITAEPGAATFLCPCHGGVFAIADGRVEDGPPPRPLDRLATRVVDEQLLVRYQDFLAGTPDRVPL